MRSIQLAHVLSFARVPLALILVICFQPNWTLLGVALLALITAYASDLADGYVARKLSATSREGQLWDSFGDKAVYIGGVIAMTNQRILDPAIAWALVLRDVGMYVSRIVYVERLDRLQELKFYSYGHCVLIYSTILAGFYEMALFIETGTFGSLVLVNALAAATFVVGAYGALRFVVMR